MLAPSPREPPGRSLGLAMDSRRPSDTTRIPGATAMLNRRLTLIGFALAMAAGTAVAATAPAPAATSGKAQAAAPKEKQTCVKHNKMGHCEKWAPAKAEKSKTEKAKTDTAAKAKESK